MITKFENCSITVISERDEILKNFTAKLQFISPSEVVATEKFSKKYEANPKIYESETLSLSLDKEGYARLFVKKFHPSSSAEFLEALYLDMKQALESLLLKQKEA